MLGKPQLQKNCPQGGPSATGGRAAFCVLDCAVSLAQMKRAWCERGPPPPKVVHGVLTGSFTSVRGQQQHPVHHSTTRWSLLRDGTPEHRCLLLSQQRTLAGMGPNLCHSHPAVHTSTLWTQCTAVPSLVCQARPARGIEKEVLVSMY